MLPKDYYHHHTQDEKSPYVLCETVLSHKEKSFYDSLLPITSKLGLTVFAKMRLADFINAPVGNPFNEKLFYKISSKHVDFILCNSDMKPVIVIEVDDKTHDRIDNKERDEFKNRLFKYVDIPLLRFRQWRGDELEKQIEEALDIEKAGV
jgi:hypothetical protein